MAEIFSLKFLIVFVLAYLLGSVNIAIILSKLFNYQDPRRYGSNNPGATNSLRLMGKKPALIILIFDILKSFIIASIALALNFSTLQIGLVCLAVFFGHLYPIFFKFHGGKGVATGLGIIFVLAPQVAVLALFVWVLVLWISKYSSLASIIAAIVLPLLTYIYFPKYLVYFTIIALFTIYRHKDNIIRLWHKTEDKMTKN